MAMKRKQTLRYWTYGLFSLYTSFLSSSIQASSFVELNESEFEVLGKPGITAIDKSEEVEAIKEYDRARESFINSANRGLLKEAFSVTSKVMKGIGQISGYGMTYLTSYWFYDSPNLLSIRSSTSKGKSLEQMEEEVRILNTEVPPFKKNPKR